jgi:hypothetical protein
VRGGADCHRSSQAGAGVFLLTDLAFETSLFEPKSPLLGNGIFRAETKRPKRLWKVQERRCRDKISLNNPAHSGLFGENPSNQAVMT